ncbi:MAG: hypothetical protein WEA04_04530 [Candidatus Andersenbacteria bacterium]
MAPILAQLLLPQLLKIAPLPQLRREAVLVPIPLARKRERERGFNQSQDIALHLSHLTDIPIIPVLARQRATWTQSHLPPDLRSRNMNQAFIATVALPSTCKVCLLIDDVTTTGATLNAAAAVFKLRPSQAVWGCTIARG